MLVVAGVYYWLLGGFYPGWVLGGWKWKGCEGGWKEGLL